MSDVGGYYFKREALSVDWMLCMWRESFCKLPIYFSCWSCYKVFSFSLEFMDFT